jgi:TRAP transporter TAXI family solute receptor
MTPERSRLALSVAAAVLILLALAATIAWLGPLPPRVVVMSTGAPGSDYDVFAQRYRTILARSGIELKLLPSAGAAENIERLDDAHSGVMVGFANGGLTDSAHSPRLESLGTLYYEPFWLFRRAGSTAAAASDLHGKKISIGQVGSGTRVFAIRFLAMNGIDAKGNDVVSLPPQRAAEALLHGEIDLAAMITAWDTQAVRELLGSSDVDLVSFPRADAYVALLPFLTKLVLPTGVGNLATNRPPQDVNLLAAKASLLVRDDLHPAIQTLLLEAASQIHSEPGIFQKAGQFPAAEPGDVPLSRSAREYYRSGASFLQRYLPFWLAVFASRLLVLLIPIVGVAYPLLRLAPALYGWSMRRRIFTLYGELKYIESELDSGRPGVRTEAAARLQRLEERADRLRLPNAFAHFIYQLRAHIALVRSRLSAQ